MPTLNTIIKGIKRLVDEKFEDYKNRIGAESTALKRYLRGKIAKPGAVYIPKLTKDRKPTKKKFRWEKVKSRKRMQKLSRRQNRRK